MRKGVDEAAHLAGSVVRKCASILFLQIVLRDCHQAPSQEICHTPMLSARVALLRLPTRLRVGTAPFSVGAPKPCAAASPERLPPPDVHKLAKLAQIAVTDEEAAVWGPQIGDIVQWFDQLQAVDVEGIPPALRANVNGANLLRDDVPRVYENREALMAEVPDREGVFVKVPKMTGSQQE